MFFGRFHFSRGVLTGTEDSVSVVSCADLVTGTEVEEEEDDCDDSS